MKFGKTYQNYKKELQGGKLPEIGYKRLKNTLKKCKSRIDDHSQIEPVNSPTSCAPDLCPVCDGSFLPSLSNEMLAVVDCFNEKVQKLLDPPLALLESWKLCCIGCKGGQENNAALIKEGQDLLIYAMLNSIAFRKILKKYDKVHNFEKGRAFKTNAQVKHTEILQSPWLYELMALHINLRDRKPKTGKFDALFEGLSLTINDDKLLMTCELFDTIKIDVELVCPICLDIVFDAVALSCGHILCYMCACSTASVTIVDGLKMASPKEKCPLCRKARVYGGAIRLDELNILLSRRCSGYWEKRLESERIERLRLVKEHWQTQCQTFMGV